MDIVALLVAFVSSLLIVLVIMPPLIRKMKEGGMLGPDINKKNRPLVSELGGIAALFAFSISLSLVVGFKKIANFTSEPPYLAAISVFFIAAMVGLIDDVSNIKQRVKAVAALFASLPLLLVHFGTAVIHLPFGLTISFEGSYVLYLIYWLVLVPIGVTGLANAMNMSAGYNGLESGQVAVISSALFLICIIRGVPDVASVIFVALIGCSLGLYYFNRFPARAFVGDIGTLGLGAAMASGVIMGHIEFYGIIAIAPAFYEAIATIYFGFIKKDMRRREACQNPIVHEDGSLSPPKGAERYTLAYLILSIKPLTEKKLVAALLGCYALSSSVAIILSVV